LGVQVLPAAAVREIDVADVNQGNMGLALDPCGLARPPGLRERSFLPLLAFDSGFPRGTECGERSLSPGLTTNWENRRNLSKNECEFNSAGKEVNP